MKPETKKFEQMKNELARKSEMKQDMVPIPEFLKASMGDMRGNEEVTQNDISIPRIELIQGLSKARKKTDPSYIDGAEEGMLFNNVTRELYGYSVKVIPIMFRKEFLLWRSIDLGGGFGGSYPDQILAQQARIERENPSEWDIVDTNQHFVMVLHDDGSTEEAVISMAKTKSRTSRMWNSLIRMNGGPRFSRVYQIEGIPAQNKSGQDYYTLSVKLLGFVTEQQFKKAEKVYAMIKSSAVAVNTEFDGVDIDLFDGGEM